MKKQINGIALILFAIVVCLNGYTDVGLFISLVGLLLTAWCSIEWPAGGEKKKD